LVEWGSTSWSDMKKIGAAFPELASLSMNRETSFPPFLFLLSHNVFRMLTFYVFVELGNGTLSYPSLACPALAELPRLKLLHISALMCTLGSGGHLNNSQLKAVINAILLACRVLEDFKLRHGAV